MSSGPPQPGAPDVDVTNADSRHREAETLHQQFNILRVWLSLETPVIEDGNSFGADVQTHLSEQLDKYHGRAGSYINGLNRHHHDRMSIVRRWVQMPHMRSHAEDLASVSYPFTFQAVQYV